MYKGIQLLPHRQPIASPLRKPAKITVVYCDHRMERTSVMCAQNTCIFLMLADGAHNKHCDVHLTHLLRNYSLFFNTIYYIHISHRFCSYKPTTKYM
jgi:hypothetical protein